MFAKLMSLFSSKPKMVNDKSIKADDVHVDYMETYQRVDEPVIENETSSLTFPPKFNKFLFLDDMLERYYIFNRAWNEGNIEVLEIYLSDALFQAGKAARDNETEKQNIEVSNVKNDIIYADFDGEIAKLTVHFIGDYHDHTKGTKGRINEKWYMERNYSIEDTLWFVIGLKTNM